MSLFFKKINGSSSEIVSSSSTPSKKEIRHYLLSYVNQIFPLVFRSNSAATRLWNEISRHHRYILLFTPTHNEHSNSSRILTTIQLLTVQSMLMFIMAVCYDLQNPDDTGTCQKITNEKDCENTKSSYDSSLISIIKPDYIFEFRTERFLF